MNDNPRTYMELLNCTTEDQVFSLVRALASGLTDKEHIILSSILFLHSVVEDELRQVIRQTFDGHLFISTDDEDAARNQATEAAYEKMVDRLGFMDMFRLLKPILVSWSYAYPELALVETLNQTRIQAAHARGLEQVSYKGRSPFTDADCLAEMYLDVFTIRKCMRKFRDKAVTRTSEILRRYIDRYGPGLC